MRQIQRFENINDFSKEIKVIEKKPEPLSAIQKRKALKDGGVIFQKYATLSKNYTDAVEQKEKDERDRAELKKDMKVNIQNMLR